MGNRQMRQLRFRGQAAVSVGGREPPRAHGAERYTRLQVPSRCCVSPRHPFRLHSAALLFTLQARQSAERPEPGVDRGPLPRSQARTADLSLASARLPVCRASRIRSFTSFIEFGKRSDVVSINTFLRRGLPRFLPDLWVTVADSPLGPCSCSCQPFYFLFFGAGTFC